MTYFHRMILKMLPGPFLGWLGTLMFLLLMQFLIKWLPDIVGRGLAFTVIAELVIYNLAYMLVLAVPMSVLIASLMTFGRLGENKTYAVMKSAGISLIQVVWPALLVALMLTGGMWYFNNEVLPEANFRARNLWLDIRQKKPDFELQPGVFYDGINGYSILVQDIIPDSVANQLIDVIVFDYTKGSRHRVDIKAARGWTISSSDGMGIDLMLEDGRVDRLKPAPTPHDEERYERLVFARHRFRLDLSDFVFERTSPRESRRSDRTMRTTEMISYVDSLEMSIVAEKARLRTLALSLLTDSIQYVPDALDEAALPTPQATRIDDSYSDRVVLAQLNRRQQKQVYDHVISQARLIRSNTENTNRTVSWSAQRADRYRVEIHKKYSIAVACLIFMLIGAPLGLSIRRGGLGTAAVLAIGIFLFFWVTLVNGEKLADRGLLTPWVGMWIANIITGTAGLWAVLYVALDIGATLTLRHRIARLFARLRGIDPDEDEAAPDDVQKNRLTDEPLPAPIAVAPEPPSVTFHP